MAVVENYLLNSGEEGNRLQRKRSIMQRNGKIKQEGGGSVVPSAAAGQQDQN